MRAPLGWSRACARRRAHREQRHPARRDGHPGASPTRSALIPLQQSAHLEDDGECTQPRGHTGAGQAWRYQGCLSAARYDLADLFRIERDTSRDYDLADVCSSRRDEAHHAAQEYRTPRQCSLGGLRAHSAGGHCSQWSEASSGRPGWVTAAPDPPRVPGCDRSGRANAPEQRQPVRRKTLDQPALARVRRPRPAYCCGHSCRPRRASVGTKGSDRSAPPSRGRDPGRRSH